MKTDLITLEDRITSLTAITIPMLMINAAIASLLSSLLLEVLDIDMVILHYLASFTLAIGIGWTVLNTSVHSYLIDESVPVMFAVGSFILLLIKFNVFKADLEHYSWYVTRVFLAIMGAAVEYTFSHLFVKKYQEVQKSKGVENMKQQLIVDIKVLQQNKSGIEQEVSELELAKSKIMQEIAKQEQRECEVCNRVFKNQKALNAHKRSCKPK